MADLLTWGSAWGFVLHRERCSSPIHFFNLEAFQAQKFIFLKRRETHTTSKDQEGLCHWKGDACCLCLEDSRLGGRRLWGPGKEGVAHSNQSLVLT